MRAAAELSVRKCWPSFGFLWGTRALELSAAGAVKELLRQRLEVLLPSFLVAKRSPL